MGQAAHHYLVFETRGGFCGIAWNKAGITRFQLPAKSADGAQRMLLRRAPGAKPGTPTLEVAEAVAAVKRHFEGKETDFSRFKLDLGEQDPLFQRIYATARQVGWGFPCHRVLVAGGKISGFSAPGGSAAKIRMLALEGVHVAPALLAQQSFGF